MPELEGELGYGMFARGRGLGHVRTWTSDDLAWQCDEVMIKFKAKAKLW